MPPNFCGLSTCSYVECSNRKCHTQLAYSCHAIIVVASLASLLTKGTESSLDGFCPKTCPLILTRIIRVPMSEIFTIGKGSKNLLECPHKRVTWKSQTAQSLTNQSRGLAVFPEVVKVLVLFHNLRVGKTHTRGSRATHYIFPLQQTRPQGKDS